MLQIRDLSFAYPGRERILERVTFSVAPAEVVCLIGANGSGKSTLLRCISGELVPGAGVVESSQEPTIVSQDILGERDLSALELLWKTQGQLGLLRQRIDNGEHELIATFAERGGYELEAAFSRTAALFDVENLLDEPCSRLSLGQIRKLHLVGAFVSSSNLLVFDEPLNHVDLLGITAFESAVEQATRRGASIVIVSHDRELVDRLAARTVVLERGRSIVLSGGYSAAREHLDAEEQARHHLASTLRHRIRALEEDARRRAGWAIRKEKSKSGAGAAKPAIAKQAKKMMSRAKAVEKQLERKREELEEQRPWIEKPIKLDWPRSEVDNRLVVRVENLSASYGAPGDAEDSTVEVLSHLDLTLTTRTRMALLGANGAGKTTLLRHLTGELEPKDGTVYRSPGATVRFLSQSLEGFFDAETLIDNFADDPDTTSEARRLLGGMKLRGDIVQRRIDELSFGQQMRAALVRIVLGKTDFLYLDEPTTHLDVESIEILERFLRDFPGGFLLVSHDRRLVSEVSDELWTLEDGRLERR